MTRTAFVWTKDEWRIINDRVAGWARAMGRDQLSDGEMCEASVALSRVSLTCFAVEARGCGAWAQELAANMAALAGRKPPFNRQLFENVSEASLASNLSERPRKDDDASRRPRLVQATLEGLLRWPLLREIAERCGRDDFPAVAEGLQHMASARGGVKPTLWQIRKPVCVRRKSSWRASGWPLLRLDGRNREAFGVFLKNIDTPEDVLASGSELLSFCADQIKPGTLDLSFLEQASYGALWLSVWSDVSGYQGLSDVWTTAALWWMGAKCVEEQQGSSVWQKDVQDLSLLDGLEHLARRCANDGAKSIGFEDIRRLTGRLTDRLAGLSSVDFPSLPLYEMVLGGIDQNALEPDKTAREVFDQVWSGMTLGTQREAGEQIISSWVSLASASSELLAESPDQHTADRDSISGACYLLGWKNESRLLGAEDIDEGSIQKAFLDRIDCWGGQVGEGLKEHVALWRKKLRRFSREIFFIQADDKWREWRGEVLSCAHHKLSEPQKEFSLKEVQNLWSHWKDLFDDFAEPTPGEWKRLVELVEGRQALAWSEKEQDRNRWTLATEYLFESLKAWRDLYPSEKIEALLSNGLAAFEENGEAPSSEATQASAANETTDGEVTDNETKPENRRSETTVAVVKKNTEADAAGTKDVAMGAEHAIERPSVAVDDPELAQIFGEELADYLEKMDDVLRQSRMETVADSPAWDRAETIMHTIKGSGSVIGAQTLAEMADRAYVLLRKEHKKCEESGQMGELWWTIMRSMRSNVAAYRTVWNGGHSEWPCFDLTDKAPLVANSVEIEDLSLETASSDEPTNEAINQASDEETSDGLLEPVLLEAPITLEKIEKENSSPHEHGNAFDDTTSSDKSLELLETKEEDSSLSVDSNPSPEISEAHNEASSALPLNPVLTNSSVSDASSLEPEEETALVNTNEDGEGLSISNDKEEEDGVSDTSRWALVEEILSDNEDDGEDTALRESEDNLPRDVPNWSLDGDEDPLSDANDVVSKEAQDTSSSNNDNLGVSENEDTEPLEAETPAPNLDGFDDSLALDQEGGKTGVGHPVGAKADDTSDAHFEIEVLSEGEHGDEELVFEESERQDGTKETPHFFTWPATPSAKEKAWADWVFYLGELGEAVSSAIADNSSWSDEQKTDFLENLKSVLWELEDGIRETGLSLDNGLRQKDILSILGRGEASTTEPNGDNKQSESVSTTSHTSSVGKKKKSVASVGVDGHDEDDRASRNLPSEEPGTKARPSSESLVEEKQVSAPANVDETRNIHPDSVADSAKSSDADKSGETEGHRGNTESGPGKASKAKNKKRDILGFLRAKAAKKQKDCGAAKPDTKTRSGKSSGATHGKRHAKKVIPPRKTMTTRAWLGRVFGTNNRDSAAKHRKKRK